MEILEIFKKRRSIRKFKDEKIETNILEEILKAGLLAPSSKNKKPVEFIVIEDKKTIQELKKCKSKGAEALNTAPCAIVIIADSQLSDVWVEDAAIASTFIQLAAEDQGLGSVWIQMRKRFNDEGDAETQIRKVLNIPENYGVLSIVALGHKDEDKVPYDLKSLNFSKVHYKGFK